MNTSMYLFTNLFKDINNQSENVKLKYKLPSSKKLYKLIKPLIKNFPEYNIDYLIDYFIKKELYQNWKEKKEEIIKYIYNIKNSVPDKSLLQKVLRETIKGIEVNSVNSSSFFLY